MDRGQKIHVKDFQTWIRLKGRLDETAHAAPLVNEGDIWWASLGENIGREICGKSEKFTRPVIIFKKLAHEFYLVIPTTSQERTGTWYVPFVHGQKDMRGCLHQVRTIDYRRLYSKIGRLDDADFLRATEGFKRLYT